MQTDCFLQENWISLKDQSSVPENLRTNALGSLSNDQKNGLNYESLPKVAKLFI
jgi:hypothetical protein